MIADRMALLELREAFRTYRGRHWSEDQAAQYVGIAILEFMDVLKRNDEAEPFNVGPSQEQNA